MTKIKSKENKKERQKLISQVMIKAPRFSASSSISQLCSETIINDGSGEDIKGLDDSSISDAIEKQEALLRKGDLNSLENMLLSQSHVLNAMFNNMINKMAGAQYLNQTEVLGRIALKAQNQTRQTISTLAEIKGIKKTTFIHQVNQAHNQQVNNGAGENSNNSANERVSTNVDTSSQTRSTEQNQQDKALDLLEESTIRDKIEGSPECVQARHEVERN